MIEQIFRWTGETGVGLMMRDSTWGFAIVETIHLLALAILGGAVLAVDLAATGLLFRRMAPALIVRSAAPVLWGALVTMITSGALLVSSKPVRYYLDPTFRTKMALLALAIVASALVTRLSGRSSDRSPPIRAAGFLSLLLWLGVGICGRLIGFL